MSLVDILPALKGGVYAHPDKVHMIAWYVQVMHQAWSIKDAIQACSTLEELETLDKTL